MKRLYYIFGLSALLLSSCNYFEYDNYEAPNSGLEGTVVDRKTNEPLQAEAANSYKVEYYELSWEYEDFCRKISDYFERRRILRSRAGSRVFERESFDPIGLFRYTLCSCEYR